MDDKLTKKSQEALSAAIRQAASDGNPQVEPVHLLMALLKQADGTAQPLLEAAGADLERVLMPRRPRCSGSSRRRAVPPPAPRRPPASCCR
jgi:ATP-dependent Clp protease ATP-binding subunit ClpB